MLFPFCKMSDYQNQVNFPEHHTMERNSIGNINS